MLNELIHIKHIGQGTAWGEHSINVNHSDIFQARGSDLNLMKFMAGKATESRRKEKPDNEDSLTLCHYKAVNQASVSQRCFVRERGL